jgi:hypothetical protein
MSDETDPPEAHLAALGPRFLAALEKRAAGKVDIALDELGAILQAEPRLGEPRLEIARIYLEMGRLDDAEAEAREGLRILEGGGIWVEDVPENIVASVGWALLGEILKERASSDEVVFGDPNVFTDLVSQSRAAFQRAAALDPTDTTSVVTAAELGGTIEDEREESDVDDA